MQYLENYIFLFAQILEVDLDIRMHSLLEHQRAREGKLSSGLVCKEDLCKQIQLESFHCSTFLWEVQLPCKKKKK